MPYGEHRVACLHCGRWYTCGDCVTFTCPACEAAGHRHIPSMGCPVCDPELAARRARVEAALACREDLRLSVRDRTRPA